MRRRPKRWIALWAAFALLFNQIALAQHLCLYSIGRLPLVVDQADIGQGQADCHGGASDHGVPMRTEAGACAVHCDDGDKQTRDGFSLKVPDLIASGSEVAQLRSLHDGAVLVAIAQLPRPSKPRRTTDFGVLLI